MANAPATPAKDNETNSEPAVVESRIALRFRDFVQREAATTKDDDNWELTAQQLDKILVGETIDEIMDADSGGTRQARDLVGMELTVLDEPFVYRESSDEFDAALGGYVQFQAVALIEYEDIQPGEQFTCSTGAPLVMGKLRTLQANGFLPFDVKIVHAGGKGVLKLVRAPRRAVPSTAS